MFGSTRIQLMIEDLSGKNLFFVSRINPHISSLFLQTTCHIPIIIKKILVGRWSGKRGSPVITFGSRKVDL